MNVINPTMRFASQTALRLRLKPFRLLYSTKTLIPKNNKKSYSTDDFKILYSVSKYLWPKNDSNIKTRVITSLGLLIAGKLLNVTVPFMFKHVIDNLDNPVSVDVISVCGTVLIGYGAARLTAVLFQELRNALFGSVTQKAIRSAAKQIFNHMLQLNSEFHLSKQTGGLVRAIDRGTKGINQVLSSIVFHIAPTIFEISVVCGILTYKFGSTYAMVTIATMISYTGYTIVTTQWRLPFRKEMNMADNAAAATATDSLLNVEAVQQFNNQELETKKYDKSLQLYENAAIKSAISLSALNAGQGAIFAISLTMMMWMAASGVLQGTMTVGDLVMINGLVFQLSMPLNFLGSVYRETRQSLLDMKTMFDMSKVTSKIIDSRENKKLVVDGGNIVFKNVSFGYTPERLILDDISFEIPAGKKVAFVGPSGCGKSTILRLISRYFDPAKGSIYIDSQDLLTVNVNSIRDALGVCPQDTILFNQTIADNIAYGKPEATFEEIQEAARNSELDKAIANFPKQYETVVGERGLMISGGEKQRVQLSRIFLKNAPIALFDEPTSALDQATETKIMETIQHWLHKDGKHRTAVFIAHRLSTIADCDLIYVLDKGKVVESGSHEELLKLEGVYSGLWRAQSRS